MESPLIHVLLVEDDQRLASLTREYLERHHIAVSTEANGERALREALRHRFDLVLLDLTLPGLDGVAVCQQLRAQSDVPIIMITARGEEADRVLGLEIGADDYVSKPFSPRELLARIRAAVRRARGKTGVQNQALAVGALELDPGSYSGRLHGKDLDLTAYEFDLLYALARRAGLVLQREQIMDMVRGGAEEAYDRSVDVHISRLRQKLGDDPRHPRWIRTVRGVGYQFVGGNDP